MQYADNHIIEVWAFQGMDAACKLLAGGELHTVRRQQRYLKKHYLYPYMRALWPDKVLAFTNFDYLAAREQYIQERIRVQAII